MADKENAADLIGGVNLGSHDRQVAKVLLDLSTTAQINDSLKVGNSFLDEIKKINRLHKNSVEQAGFAVLKAPDIPSILVETAFISNPQEEAATQRLAPGQAGAGHDDGDPALLHRESSARKAGRCELTGTSHSTS